MQRAQIYQMLKGTPSLIQSLAMTQFDQIQAIVLQNPSAVWCVLVDQSEESFWSSAMPRLRGRAKAKWLAHLANQKAEQAIYRWTQVQGVHASERHQLQVLGYGLGAAQMVTPWLDALARCHARIRGVYAPFMLVKQVLNILGIKRSQQRSPIQVLITPHAEGMRQVVLMNHKVRFSRLALNPWMHEGRWQQALSEESAKLRHYLTTHELLQKGDVEIDFYVVSPPNAGSGYQRDNISSGPSPQVNDRYHFFAASSPDLLYVEALALRQPWQQLAPDFYCLQDRSLQMSQAVYLLGGLIAASSLLYGMQQTYELWQQNAQIQPTIQHREQSYQQYQSVVKTFPPSPLTAAQLVTLRDQWQELQSATSIDIKQALSEIGGVLERHPDVQVDELSWEQQPLIGNAQPQPADLKKMPESSRDHDDPARVCFVVKGAIPKKGNEDLHITLDRFNHFIADLNQQPNLRAEIIKKPIDVTPQSVFVGSHQQAASENLIFEMKVWQR